jgi:hypothetical protein
MICFRLSCCRNRHNAGFPTNASIVQR